MLALYVLLSAILYRVLSIWLRRGKGKKTSTDTVLSREVTYRVLQKGTASKTATRIVVTGGRGYLGRHVVADLLQELGDSVHLIVFDLNPSSGDDPRVTYIRGDLGSASTVREVLKDAAIVVHIAGLVQTASSTRAQMMHVNYECTKEVLEACLDLNVRGLVYTSSVLAVMPMDATAFSALPEGCPYPAQCHSDYGESKKLAERLVLAAPSHLLRTIVLRPGGIYGVGDNMMVDLILTNSPFMGHGTQAIPLAWVRDVSRAHVVSVKALLQPSTPATRAITGRAYHICHDPVADPFSYRFFSGGDGGKGKPNEVNPWGGRRYARSLPMWLVHFLCAFNEWTVRYLGWVSVTPLLFTANVATSSRQHTYDVSGAKSVLGWTPTPFREAASRVMAEVAAAKGAVPDVVKKTL